MASIDRRIPACVECHQEMSLKEEDEMTDDEKIALARDALARLTRKLNAVEHFLIAGKRPAARHDSVFNTSPPRPLARRRPALPPLGFYH